MKVTSFKELLLKKTEGDSNLQFLIKNTKDEFFSEHMLEVLEKMAEDKRRPRSSNGVVEHFGAYALDKPGNTANLVHDALSHHASRYKAAINSDQKHLAGQHMKKIHGIMHFSRKLGHDGVTDHGAGKLNIEAVDPKPWERSGFPSEKPGKLTSKGKPTFVTDTKGWSRDSGNFEYMQGNPHESYGKEVEGHGHKGSYPLEEMKVNGKYLHIDDDVELNGYEGHAFDEHPIMKDGMYRKSARVISDNSDEKLEQYKKDVDAFDDSDHMNNHYDKHDKLMAEDPEGYANRGKNKPDKIIRDSQPVTKPAEAEASKESSKPDALADIHKELTDEEINHPSNKKILDAIGSGSINLDKDTILSLIRGDSKQVKKSLHKIKESLVKNKEFLKDNPELLIGIRDRLIKADESETDKWLRENDPSYSEDQYDDNSDLDFEDQEDPSYGMDPDLFKPEDAETDNEYEDEDRHLVETEKPQMVDINDEGSSIPQETPVSRQEQGSKGGSKWRPRDDYTPEQQEKINAFVEEGYHPGDAELLAGAHRTYPTLDHAANYGFQPHTMSEKMHERLRDIANLHVDQQKEDNYSRAEPEFNPQKATAGAMSSSGEFMQNFRDKKDAYEDSDAHKNLSPRERRKAIKAWTAKYHEENPDHEKSIAERWSNHGKIDKENWEKRDARLEEGKKAIAEAGQTDTDAGENINVGSRNMAMDPSGDTHTETKQGVYQSAGLSSTEEGGKPLGTTITDPYATFAEKNPEYTKKLQNSLDDKGKARLKRIDALKRK